MKTVYFVRPETGCQDVFGPVLGPFDEYIQLTYGDIRVGPDGETIGCRNPQGMWVFNKTYRPKNKEIDVPCNTKDAHNCPDFAAAEFSDVVIWAESVP